MDTEEIQHFTGFKTNSEKETALFFDSLGLECVSLCSNIKADDGSDITDLDGIFVDRENKIILIYDDSEQKKDATSKIALFFTKCSQTKYEQQIYLNHPALPHYPIKILYVDKSRNKKRENIRLGALEFILTDHMAILYKDDFDYFKNLISQIGEWAKNDLYNYLNIKLPNSHIEINATKIYIGNTPAYIYASKPHDILKYAYVSRRRGNDEGYQRMIDFSRMNLIANKLVQGKITGFMNSILLNSTIKLDEKEKVSKSHTPSPVKLIVPNHFSSCRVVDGQHRLLSFTKLSEIQQSKYSLPVVLMDNLSIDEEKKMFLEINKNAKPVDPNLEYEIVADISNWDEESDEFYTRLAVLTIKALSKSQIIKGKVYFGTVGETKTDSITLKAFVDLLKKHEYISRGTNIFGDTISSEKNIKTLVGKINEILSKANNIIVDKDFIISNRIIELVLGYASEILKGSSENDKDTKNISHGNFIEDLTAFFQKINSNTDKLKDSKAYGGSSYKIMRDFILEELKKENETNGHAVLEPTKFAELDEDIDDI